MNHGWSHEGAGDQLTPQLFEGKKLNVVFWWKKIDIN